jgi:hypothetical protein
MQQVTAMSPYLPHHVVIRDIIRVPNSSGYDAVLAYIGETRKLFVVRSGQECNGRPTMAGVRGDKEVFLEWESDDVLAITGAVEDVVLSSLAVVISRDAERIRLGARARWSAHDWSLKGFWKRFLELFGVDAAKDERGGRVRSCLMPLLIVFGLCCAGAVVLKAACVSEREVEHYPSPSGDLSVVKVAISSGAATRGSYEFHLVSRSSGWREVIIAGGSELGSARVDWSSPFTVRFTVSKATAFRRYRTHSRFRSKEGRSVITQIRVHEHVTESMP